MTNKFFQYNCSYKTSSDIKNEIQKLSDKLKLEELDTENINDKFSKLIKTYSDLKQHCRILESGKRARYTNYHDELALLKAFIEYVIAYYRFPHTFQELLEDYKNSPEYIEDERIIPL
jgi:ABC-type transporter MlaC component